MIFMQSEIKSLNIIPVVVVVVVRVEFKEGVRSPL